MKNLKICLLILLVFSFLIPNTYAITSHVDITGIPQTDRIYISKYTNTSNDYSEIGSTFSSFPGTTAGVYYHTTSSFNLDSLGVSVAFVVDLNIAKNYIYSLNAIVCSNSPYYIGDSSVNVYTANGQYQATKKQNMVYSNTVLTNLENTLYYHDNGYDYSLTSGACYNVSSTFTPSVDGNWVNIAISNGANRSVSELRFMGYRIEGIGLYDGTVQSILNAQSNQISGLQTQIQQVQTTVDDTNKELGDINDSINDSDTSSSQDKANGFFDDFTDNDYGLSSIITIPLTSIQKITSATCSPLRLPIPFVNKTIDLPCMYDIYNNVPTILNIWQIVSFGIISYAIIVDIFGLVKKFKDPNDDKLEVMDL